MITTRRLVIALVGITVTPIILLVLAFNVPVTLALGPCLKDWTSPSTYRPRASKLATTDVLVGTETVRICYGRPSARERLVFDGLVPYGRLWRAGANEPTRLFTSKTLEAGTVILEPGRYSIYVIPTDSVWEIFFSRSTFHWGNMINQSVREREVGSVVVPVGATDEHVETLIIRGAPRSSSDTDLLFEWEQTQVALPLRTVERVRPD